MNDETGIDNKLSIFEVVLLSVWSKVTIQECGQGDDDFDQIREFLQIAAIFTDFLLKRSGQPDRHIKNFCHCLCKYMMFSHFIGFNTIKLNQIPQ